MNEEIEIPKGMKYAKIMGKAIAFYDEKKIYGIKSDGSDFGLRNTTSKRKPALIGKLDITFIKEILELDPGASMIEIYYDSKKKELGACKVGKYYLAPIHETK